jgi:hypothetical protein
MKNTVIVIAIIFSLGTAGYAQNFAKQKEKFTIAEPREALKTGEVLSYSLEWLGIPMGNITLKAENIKNINGRDCYHITARATPNRFFSKFYDVEYIVNTYIDTNTFQTLRFEKTRRLRDKFHYVEIDFDWEKEEARYKAQGSAETILLSPVRGQIEANTPITLKIMSGVQDLFSSFYCLRLMQLEVGKDYSINIYYDQRNWKLNLKAEEPFLKDIRDKGTFLIFGVFIDSRLSEYILGRSNITVYLTADPRRIPVEFKFSTGIGPMRGKIKNPL